MPTFCVQPKRSPLGRSEQIGGLERQGAGGAGLGGYDGLEDGEIGLAGTQCVGGQRGHLESL